MIALMEKGKEVLSQCVNCLKKGCIHKHAYRRLSRVFGGLDLWGKRGRFFLFDE